MLRVYPFNPSYSLILCKIKPPSLRWWLQYSFLKGTANLII
nr:MAG TPA: RAI1 like PD-(D/E)XK nuclease [Caudoviricetes sp.]